MSANAAFVRIIERIHAPESDTQAWLDGIREHAEAALQGSLDVQVYAFTIGTGDTLSFDGLSRSRLASVVQGALSVADASTVAMLRDGPVMHGSRRVAPDHPSRMFAERAGIGDVITAVGFASTVKGLAISVATPRELPVIPRSTLLGLRRVAAHLGAGLRLRSAGDIERRQF